jgi:hypothetical protein
MHDRHNARVQLTPTLLNNIALAFAVGGFIGPATSLQSDGAGRFIYGLIFLVIGFASHVVGRAVLKGIIPVSAGADWYARRVGVAAAREINKIPAGRLSNEESIFRPAGIRP